MLPRLFTRSSLMKNVITLLFLFLLLISFSACAGNGNEKSFDVRFGFGTVYAQSSFEESMR